MPALFFLVALLYAMVGFGGGSSYIALLALADYPYEWIPIIALICNLLVVSGSTVEYIRKKQLPFRPAGVFLAASVPMAFIGGRLPLSSHVFYPLLGVTLTAAGIRLIAARRTPEREEGVSPGTLPALAVGAGLGLLSGMVGIGGGIFLAPVLLNLRWAGPRQTAAICALFILVNSLAGLAGQLIKNPPPGDLWSYWPLFAAVLLGGQIGCRLGLQQLRPWHLRILTGLLVLFVGVRVLFRALS